MMCIPVIHTDIGSTPTPDEADTVTQAQFLADNLTALGYHAPLLPFHTDTLPAQLKKLNAIAVVNMVESVDGDDERAPEGPEFFETLGLPYTGNTADTLRALINKTDVKRKLQQHNLPTPAFPEDGAQGKQWILKSETFHCSRGMDHRNVSSDLEGLRTLAAECAQKFGGEWFMEEYIPGREINMAMLDTGYGTATVLPASEIRFIGQEPHIVDYDCKWTEGSPSWNNALVNMDFTPQEQAMLDRLAALSLACWKAFDLKGYVRVDFRIDKAGNPYILEINANPCLSDDAGFMRAARASGLTTEQVMERLITPLLNQETDEARRA